MLKRRLTQYKKDWATLSQWKHSTSTWWMSSPANQFEGRVNPLTVTKTSDLVHRLVPCMHIGLRAMSLYNGVAGIARMFHPGIPTIPEEWCKGASDSIALLK